MWKKAVAQLGIVGTRRSSLPALQSTECRVAPPVEVGALTPAECERRRALAKLVSHRLPPVCKAQYIPHEKACFDVESALVEYGTPKHEKFIRSFLYSHYWPKEPTIKSLWMQLSSPYLDVQTERYCCSGDRWIVFELEQRTKERKMVGLLVANKVCPWTVKELDCWAEHLPFGTPEQVRVAFQAHCLKESNLFSKYKVPYIYDIEVIATVSEVTTLAVAELLLRTAITRAMELRHPLVQVIAKCTYVAKLCQRLGMTEEWSMEYRDFRNYKGQQLFYDRGPHRSVVVYSRPFSQKEGSFPDICTSPLLWQTYVKQISRRQIELEETNTCFSRENMHYTGGVIKKDRDRFRPCECTCYRHVHQDTFLPDSPPECYRSPMTKNFAEPMSLPAYGVKNK